MTKVLKGTHSSKEKPSSKNLTYIDKPLPLNVKDNIKICSDSKGQVAHENKFPINSIWCDLVGQH